MSSLTARGLLQIIVYETCDTSRIVHSPKQPRQDDSKKFLDEDSSTIHHEYPHWLDPKRYTLTHKNRNILVAHVEQDGDLFLYTP